MKKESVSISVKKTSITINKILSRYYQDIIRREMKSGKYSSAIEVIRAGLRLFCRSI